MNFRGFVFVYWVSFNKSEIFYCALRASFNVLLLCNYHQSPNKQANDGSSKILLVHNFFGLEFVQVYPF